jgi:hypothetical protein
LTNPQSVIGYGENLEQERHSSQCEHSQRPSVIERIVETSGGTDTQASQSVLLMNLSETQMTNSDLCYVN